MAFLLARVDRIVNRLGHLDKLLVDVFKGQVLRREVSVDEGDVVADLRHARERDDGADDYERHHTQHTERRRPRRDGAEAVQWALGRFSLPPPKTRAGCGTSVAAAAPGTATAATPTTTTTTTNLLEATPRHADNTSVIDGASRGADPALDPAPADGLPKGASSEAMPAPTEACDTEPPPAALAPVADGHVR